MKILVTGANGQLGRCLQKSSQKYTDAEFHFLGREHLPIHDLALSDKVIAALKPDVIINTAAYTTVDKAEAEVEIANLVNGFAVGNLAAAAKRIGAIFFHISTDYVFNGKGNRPYKEEDDTDPINIYGQSKLLGEQLAMQENPQSIIIRTSWVYSEFGKNFVKTMVELMRVRPFVKVVSDQFGTPTSAHDLAKAILDITFKKELKSGYFHFANKGQVSWYEFALKINEIKQFFNCEVHPITTENYPTPARRPGYSCLDCTKIEKIYKVEIPFWEDSLKIVLSRL